MRITLRRYVHENEWMPTLYGLAWRDYVRGAKVCYPVPLNWLFRWARDLYWWLAVPGLSWRERAEAAEIQLAEYRRRDR